MIKVFEVNGIRCIEEVDDSVIAAMDKMLAEQWPKQHLCRLSNGELIQKYITPEEWAKLDFACPFEDEYALGEMRHCTCGSTLLVLTKILDITKQ